METLFHLAHASEAMFFARPRLATAASLSLVGIVATGLGVFALWRGLARWMEVGADGMMIGLAASALALLAFGSVSVQSGIRSFELFERKLLLTISSRGRVSE